MRLRNVRNAKEKLESSNYYIKNPENFKNNWLSLNEKCQKVNLEIGCGKGNFILSMAENHKDTLFIAIEKYESVLIRAVEKANLLELDNVKFICVDAKRLTEFFGHEIDTLYLNFSDPWPKTRHAKRRLTSPVFLNIYDELFKDKKHIVQKTDNINLFSYSLETLSNHGYVFKKVSLDLANENIENYKTEYEERFMNDGYKINYLDALK